jgi:hypothetical protein
LKIRLVGTKRGNSQLGLVSRHWQETPDRESITDEQWEGLFPCRCDGRKSTAFSVLACDEYVTSLRGGWH